MFRYLKKLRARLKQVHPNKNSILQHDNARPHTSRQTEAALQVMDFTTLPHPSYSPDLAPSDFFLFPKLKECIKGNHYESDDDVKSAVRAWLKQKTPDFFADGMHQLVHRWELCVQRNGDYVRK